MRRSSQALLSKSIAESKGKLHTLHAFSRGPRRKVNACTLVVVMYDNVNKLVCVGLNVTVIKFM